MAILIFQLDCSMDKTTGRSIIAKWRQDHGIWGTDGLLPIHFISLPGTMRAIVFLEFSLLHSPPLPRFFFCPSLCFSCWVFATAPSVSQYEWRGTRWIGFSQCFCAVDFISFAPSFATKSKCRRHFDVEEEKLNAHSLSFSIILLSIIILHHPFEPINRRSSALEWVHLHGARFV